MEVINRAHERANILREIVELLRRELALVSEKRWEDLPELKRRKVLLASRLRFLAPARNETVRILETLVQQLEKESSRQIKAQMELIGRQIYALQELKQYWAECLSVSFGKYC